jgi:two-component system NarL family response regulator
MTTRILIADDHAAIRAVLRVILSRQPDVEVVAEAEDGSAAVRMADEQSADVVFMDLQMPGLTGIEATRQIVSANPRAKVIGVSTHSERPVVQQMLDAGAVGYVQKHEAAAQLRAALDAVLQDKVYLSPSLSETRCSASTDRSVLAAP